MKLRPLKTLLAVSGLLGGAVALQGQILLAGFDFTDAPTSIPAADLSDAPPEFTTMNAETVAPGFGTASFSVVRNTTVNRPQSGIANVDGSSNVGAAQIAGQNNSTYAWAQDPESVTANYFQFTVDFGSVSANEITFGELVLVGRTGVEWDNNGNFVSRNSRQSAITVRSSVDGYSANIGGEVNPSFSNVVASNGNIIDTDWRTTTIDLSGLVLTGSETAITFRIYTKTPTTNFHRTQLNTVELYATAIPEPRVYAALFGLFALGFVAWRRRRS